MDIEKHSYKLTQIPANRRLVEELYLSGLITLEAKKSALKLLYPNNQWFLWISRLLLTFGVTLILSGLIYFFAFNWTKIPTHIKLLSIEFVLIICILGSYFYSLKSHISKILLVCGSVLVGIFMAVFGQIYQTGADSYQLFMTWSLLIFGWTLIANYTPQWLLWVIVTNIFIILWWQQAAAPAIEMEQMIFTYIAIFNGLLLILFEYNNQNNLLKLSNTAWIRSILVLVIIWTILIPILAWIIAPKEVTKSIILSSILGIIIHICAYYFYRYKLPSMWALAIITLSSCIILVSLIFKILLQNLFFQHDPAMFLTLGLFTLAIFSTAIIYLRNIAKEMEVSNA